MLYRVVWKFLSAVNFVFCFSMLELYNFVYIKVETTKEKIVSLELSTPEAPEMPEMPFEEHADKEEEASEKKPSNPSGNKKKRRKRTKSTDKQTS